MRCQVAENKTKPTGVDPQTFIMSIADQSRRADARIVCDMLARITGEPAEMWGPSIVGFGRRHLRYESGREVDSMEIGFSPRKAYTAIYLAGGLDRYGALLARLGSHTTGGGCLYLKRVGEADPAVLQEILALSVAQVRASGS
jgi:hypothetical protein